MKTNKSEQCLSTRDLLSYRAMTINLYPNLYRRPLPTPRRAPETLRDVLSENVPPCFSLADGLEALGPSVLVLPPHKVSRPPCPLPLFSSLTTNQSQENLLLRSPQGGRPVVTKSVLLRGEADAEGAEGVCGTLTASPSAGLLLARPTPLLTL